MSATAAGYLPVAFETGPLGPWLASAKVCGDVIPGNLNRHRLTTRCQDMLDTDWEETLNIGWLAGLHTLGSFELE